MANPFGSLGVWISRHRSLEQLVPVAVQADRLDYDTVWIGGGGEPGVFDLAETVLAATERVRVATGIANIWVETPASVAEAYEWLEAAYPGRLYVGLGISHARTIRTLDLDYSRPLARTREFLDALDAQPSPVPHDRLVLAALGPRMLRLAGERTLGAHPYLATPQNTAAARAGVGADALVATELGVVLDPDLGAARRQAREALAYYLGLPNYTNNWRRSGFTEEDLADGGSDRLLDALFALGDADAVLDRVAAHRAAGADHVCLQVLGDADPATVLGALRRAR
jgi:probable F420-dependent oxidoreductase